MDTKVALLTEICVDDAVATVAGLDASVGAPVLAEVQAISLTEVALLGAVDLAIATKGTKLALFGAGAIESVGVVGVAVVTFLAGREDAVATTKDAGIADFLSAVCTRSPETRAARAVPAGLNQTIAGAAVAVHRVPVVAGFPPDHLPIAANGKATPAGSRTAPARFDLARL
jgi:hypothetical protein